MSKDVKWLTISDLHLGHSRNKTQEIVDHLDLFFDHYTVKSQFTDLDAILIAGDLFDCLLSFASVDIHLSTLWLGRLMGFCSRYNIALRILEGTPSHDWKQSKISDTAYGLIDKPLDFRYIDTLHIEYMERLGMHVLYIPDEWTHSADLTLSQVRQLLAEMNLEQVDIGIFHGCFPYQLPSAAKNIPAHDPAAYLSIVKHWINIGHIHIHSHYERIIAQGSFDRISQGEEGPKGGIVCRVSEKHGNSFSFIENKHAKIFKTIELKSRDLDKSLVKLEKFLSTIPDNSYIRIKTHKDHPLYVAFTDLKLKYPMYTFSKISFEEDDEDHQLIKSSPLLDEEYVPISITKTNIVSMIMQEVGTKYQLQDTQKTLLMSLLEETNGSV